MPKDIKGEQEIYMNYVKAFAIVAMVCGHAASPLNPYIYQYHMALFMFVAGYFYKDYYTEHPITLIWKRIKSLYIPFLVYNIIFIFLSSVCDALNITDRGRHILGNINLVEMLKSLVSFNSYADYLGGFWFVKTLFLTTVAYCLISFVINKIKLTKEGYRAGIIVIIYVIAWIMIKKELDLSKNIIQVPMTLVIFCLGYLYNKYRENITLNLYGFLISIWVIYANAQLGIIDIDSLSFMGPVFYIVSSLAGAYVNIYIAEFLAKKLNKIKYLDFIGRSTYAILAIHLLTQDILRKMLKVTSINLGKYEWIVDVVIAINISVVIYYCYLKLRDFITNKIKERKVSDNE